MSAAKAFRFAWASPWNEHSAIAAFGLGVISELMALGHHVDVIRSECGPALDLAPRSSPATVRIASTMTRDVLTNEYDAVVVNLGNNFAFHGGALPMMREVPAHVVILHDAWMGDFMGGWRAAAGPDAVRIDAWQGAFADDPSGLAALCPMADCAIVHSSHYRDAVEQATPGRVAQLPLAFVFDPIPDWIPPSNGRLKVATVGHVNLNKRITEVVRALKASARLRDRTGYQVIGLVQAIDEAALTKLATEGSALDLTFTGPVSDDTLRSHLATTDVICCLRNPLTEGGSASVIMAMQAGRPVIVSDHGSFAEIPDGLVLKCPPGAEAAHVVRHLEWILDEPDKARTMALNARDYAYRVYHPKRYAHDLLGVIDDAIAAAPMLRAARSIGEVLAELGIRAGDPAIERVARSLETMGRKT